MEFTTMIEIRIHGRGGQGAVTSAEMLALAAIGAGKYAQAFPSFGPERRGAPVQAFVRVSDKPIRVRGEIKEPNVVVVLDPGLLNIMDVSSGLRDKGIIVVNTKVPVGELKARFKDKWTVAAVDASAIAMQTIGVNIVNTTMIGGILKACEVVTMESLNEPLKHRFGGKASANLDACKKAYEKTVIA
jgi:pyruvate ferredoxin oxidoreductase gamma subunit